MDIACTVRPQRDSISATPASSKDSDAPKDNKKTNELPTTFIVSTAVPDHGNSPYAGYPQPPNLEYHARGGCIVELKNIPGVKVIEDEDVERWEARQTALTEDKAYLIWMELRWDKTTSINSAPFRLRYLLSSPEPER